MEKEKMNSKELVETGYIANAIQCELDDAESK